MANRLARETSPYLLQHADNPVDWYPWGDEAFARARDEDRAVLVSIGYSACHWCHVMERESFENDEIAALMNERFVCIKVDREEHPDVDAIYMDATQAMTGAGRLADERVPDPRRDPVLVRHLLPARAAPGAAELAERAALRSARRGTSSARRSARRPAAIVERLRGAAALKPPEAEIDPGSLDAAVDALRKLYDPEHGGFGRAPKFPPSSVIEFLLGRGEREMALHTLRRMACGRHVRPDRRRLRPLLGRPHLARPALREDALRQRAARPRVPARLAGHRRAAVRARVPRDARLGARRAAPGGGRVRLRARRRLRGRRGQVLRLDARRRSTRCSATRSTRRSSTSG